MGGWALPRRPRGQVPALVVPSCPRPASLSGTNSYPSVPCSLSLTPRSSPWGLQPPPSAPPVALPCCSCSEQSFLNKVRPALHPEVLPGPQSLSINPKFLHLSSGPATPPGHLCHLLSLPRACPRPPQRSYTCLPGAPQTHLGASGLSPRHLDSGACSSVLPVPVLK